ncbi:protein of unknown function DUF92 transmembrane [Caldithrix abyssi DSM 13497]|uniref:TIGR00297 family protein n=1 Tax=Caldithrix abyssi DSM 13497 TaxID=880073 RepID=H1XUZ6_CALAY|nr:DUF92 domain-containing protein [Caldithrix abyssi]APF18862.1 TIGR00297 family protein [Caldithrix abyssi DSM 13497]EHO42829.1 protein of unknown function DUF92 transmembrane [Caldithrix abyssi DSM 13497]
MDWNSFLTAPQPADLILAVGAFLLILLILLISVWLKKILDLSHEVVRKFSHMGIGVLAALAPLYFSTPLLLLLLSLLFLTVNWVAVKKGLLKSIHSGRYSFGTVYFPLVYMILILIFWNIDRRFILLGIALFAIADALAALVGQRWGKSTSFTLVADQKSLLGSIAMFISSFALIYLILKFSFEVDRLLVLQVIALAALVTVVEALSSKGSDNFFVPFSGAVLAFLLVNFNEAQLNRFLSGEILALITAILSYRFRFLSLSGSAMVFLLATVIFGFGGWAWSVPILTFFILSSLLSKLGKNTKNQFKDTFEKSGVRDYAQVLANGGIGGALVILNALFPDRMWYQLYLLSLMVATSDTWSTEIGVLSKSNPRLITTFRKVKPGISGAVSLLGTAGGFLGSALILLSGLFFTELNGRVILWLLLLGLLGNLLDSLIGATVQGQYQCSVCGKYTEKKMHCDRETSLISGSKIIGNDMVNVASNLMAIILMVIIYYFHVL